MKEEFQVSDKIKHDVIIADQTGVAKICLWEEYVNCIKEHKSYCLKIWRKEGGRVGMRLQVSWWFSCSNVLSLPNCSRECMVLDFVCCVPSVHGVSCVCTVPCVPMLVLFLMFLVFLVYFTWRSHTHTHTHTHTIVCNN